MRRIHRNKSTDPAGIVGARLAGQTAINNNPYARDRQRRFRYRRRHNDTPRTGPSADAVVAGFPEGGPYEAVPARVRIGMTAVGDDIYGQSGVQREIYSLRADVRTAFDARPAGVVVL